MKNRIPALFIVVFLVSFCGCGLPIGANYSPYTVTADAVTAAEPYENAPAESVALPDNPVSYTGSELRITKDPTDETVSPGGGAWFVAKAENAASVRWELTDTYGTVFSAEEVPVQHPELIVSGADSDALSLYNVPLFLDGWKVRAVFEGEGGPLTTASASLSVIDHENPYSCILMRYSKAFLYGPPTVEYCRANGISERASTCSGVAYALRDIDENGVDELLIAASFPEETGYRGNRIFELYTIADSAPARIFCSSLSSELYLLNEGRLLTVSGGNTFLSYGIYHLSGDFLLYDEVYLAEWEADDPDARIWRHRIDSSIGYSDDNPISSFEALQAVDQLFALTCLPALTPIY
jgi:hypothetical protein